MAAEKKPELKILLAFDAGQEWQELTGQLSRNYQITTVHGEYDLKQALTCENGDWSAFLLDSGLYMKLQARELWERIFAAAAEKMPLMLLLTVEVPPEFLTAAPVTDIISGGECLRFVSGRVDRTIQSFRLQKFMQCKNAGMVQNWEKLAWIDTMTGLYNRRYCMERLEELRKEKKAFSVCFADADCLKQVNDTYGHESGDKYIITISEALKQVISVSGIVCRIYGDEFVIILPEYMETEAAGLMDKVNHILEEKSKELSFSMGISFGIQRIEQDCRLSIREILNMVDRKMYLHKAERAV